jgi:hypothetical protein
MRGKLFLLIALVSMGFISGCGTTTDFGVKAGPGFDVDVFNLGSGQPVFSPANDNYFCNGDPMDCRTRH